MAHVKFISKGKVDGREYNKGNTLDVDEATKSRLLKEGCIKNDDENVDCSELQGQVIALKEELSIVQNVRDANVGTFNKLLEELQSAKTIADYKAVVEKYKKAD